MLNTLEMYYGYYCIVIHLIGNYAMESWAGGIV